LTIRRQPAAGGAGKEHFPHLQIISRARDVDHYIQLRQAGVEAPERETFEAALKSGE
jgi:glutathione-regulated potassium-efflux system ancillary protein KefC